MCNVSCDHINSYKSEHGLNSYEILHAFYVSCIAKDSRKRKARDCLCMTESCPTRCQRIHACLSCVYFGCYNGGHIHEHAKENGHTLAIDTNFGYVYCFVCGDYQYDVEFEKIAQKQRLCVARRKGQDPNFKWEPNVNAELLSKHIIINVDHIGFRGIINMGNTCYMSVILQSLVHAPVFRDYFLSFKHRCSIQNKCSESQVQTPDQVSVNERLRPVCFACEMSEIVQEFFSGKVEPYVPDRLLYLVWLNLDTFKNPGQHDAHEFFLELLNYLHLHCQGTNGNVSGSNDLCNCIIDTMFTGSLQYEYTCQICKSVSIVPNSFKDISLDTDSPKLSPNNDANGVSSEPQSSLHYYLMKTMQSDETFQRTCDNCEATTAFRMKQTLKKLPLIISFHVKQHIKQEDKSNINIPEFLDLTPHMVSHNKANEKDKSLNGLNRCISNKFYLFAVVIHSGALIGGHYTCYVRRHKTKWFYCDDVKVEPKCIEDILENKAYLLFYHKQILEYENNK